MKIFSKSTLKYYPRLVVATLVSVYLAFACAKVIHPEGGPKDLVPPKLLSTYPIHGSTMFKGRKITLTFDKEVDQKGLYTKLKISPCIKKEDSRGYTYRARGKTIEIELDEDLETDRTYTFNFDDCIVDITEGNAAESVVLTFSTGAEIDEMQAEGMVVDTLTNMPVANAYVFFYALDGSIAFKDQNKILTEDPAYFTKTDKSGRFSIANLKEGDYKVYAKYTDAGVFKFNSTKDKAGVVPYPVCLKKNNAADFLVIKVIEADLSELKVVKATPRGPHFEVNFSKPIEEYSFAESDLCSNLSDDKRSVYIFNTQKNQTDSEIVLQTILLARDSVGESIEQEVSIVLNSKNEHHIKSYFTISPSPNSNLSTSPTITIKSQKPFASLEDMDKSGVILYLNESPLFLSDEDFSLNASENKITISYDLSSETLNLEEDMNLYLAITPGAIKDIDGGAIGNAAYAYKVANPKKFGSISGSVYADAVGNDFKIQLVGLDSKVVDEIYSYEMDGTLFRFKLVRPGKYLLRVLCFSPGSRFWSPGNILRNQPASRVEIYSKLVEMLENWEANGVDFYVS